MKKQVKETGKDQLKVQISPDVHRRLRALCDQSRRTPAGQIEFMTIMFHRHDLERRLPPAADRSPSAARFLP